MVSLEDAAALLTTHHAATSNSAVGSVPDDFIMVRIMLTLNML